MSVLDINTSEHRVAIVETMQLEEGGKEFSWDKWTQGMVLGSFYWGYAITNLIGGRISEYLGGKTVMGLGIFAASLLSLITPLAARASVQALITCRIFLGIAQVRTPADFLFIHPFWKNFYICDITEKCSARGLKLRVRSWLTVAFWCEG